MTSFKANKKGTVNRGSLKKMIEMGLVLAICNRRYDDHGDDQQTKRDKSDYRQARIKANDTDHRLGFANFDADDFTSTCGRAWLSEDGESVTFLIHMGESWTLKLVSK